MKFLLLRSVAGLGAALALAGCARREASAPEPASPILRISQRNEPEDLDPATAALPDDFFVIRALGEGLLVPTPAGPAAAAAERWEISPDGLVYTFYLRPDGRWSNGEAATAEDFVASFRRALTPATAAPKADLFFPVKNARAYVSGEISDFSRVGLAAPDPHTVVVTLERPNSGFLAYAASGPWIPINPRVVRRLGRQWTRPGNYVGNGPFVLAEWLPSQRISVRRNPAYRGAPAVRLAGIQFIRFDDGDAEERAYRSGDVDVTMALPPTKLETYARERPAELRRMPLAETRYLSFNLRLPPLGDVRVRRALSLAIDRGRVVDDVLQGGQTAAGRLLPPALSSLPALRHPGPARGGDPEQARRLLAEAGFPGGRGFPRLELSGWNSTPVLEAIQAMWKKVLGIDVSVVVRDARVHVASLRSGSYDIGFMTLIPDVADPLPILEGFTSASPDNYPHWADPKYDALVGEAATDGVPGSRAARLSAAEGYLLEACPLAPLYFNAKNWAMRPYVIGWEETALWERYYPSLGVVPEAASR